MNNQKVFTDPKDDRLTAAFNRTDDGQLIITCKSWWGTSSATLDHDQIEQLKQWLAGGEGK